MKGQINQPIQAGDIVRLRLEKAHDFPRRSAMILELIDPGIKNDVFDPALGLYVNLQDRIEGRYYHPAGWMERIDPGSEV